MHIWIIAALSLGLVAVTAANEDYDFTFEVNRVVDPRPEEELASSDDDEGYGLSNELREVYKREPYKKLRKWQSGWRRHPLFVIILGGFRWDLVELNKKNLTAFAYLRQHGATIEKVNPVFPTEDYPVWTSISTGQYVEDHSIVGNFMYDLKYGRMFNSSDAKTTREAEWWKHATPFWSSAAKKGRKIAFYNWHDCLIPGAALEEASDCRPFRGNGAIIPSKSRIAREFDEAFTKLYKGGYHLTLVHTDLLRRVSEVHGPVSGAMTRALQDIDDILQAKLTDIRSKDERAGMKMNLLVLSDYGMTDASLTTEVAIEDYVNLDDVQYIIYSAGYAAIVPFAQHHENIIRSLDDMPGVDVYIAKKVQDPPIWGTTLIPEGLKFGRGAWTQDILVVAKPSFQITSSLDDGDHPKVVRVHAMADEALKAGIGYRPRPEEVLYPYIDKRTVITRKINDTIRDYHLYHKHKMDMVTQAYALGPDFKRSHVVREAVESVDFYQLICFLLQIPAEEHDGSWSRIEGMLSISRGCRAWPAGGLVTMLVLLCYVPLIN